MFQLNPPDILAFLGSTTFRRMFLSVLIWVIAVATWAQDADYRKLSYLVRNAWSEVSGEQNTIRSAPSKNNKKSDVRLMAFVRTIGEDNEVFESNGCERLATLGDIHIVSIPLANVGHLSLNRQVMRIEAGTPSTAQLDTVLYCVEANPVYAGDGLPQAYTGKGVVLGIQDIGFDLTHPSFYSSDFSEYRIKAFWDQLAPSGHEAAEELSTDDPLITHQLPVGRDFTSLQSLLRYAHSLDSRITFHGTHTLGIAAGSGGGSPYRGMAWESDICAVSNATSNNAKLIDEDKRYLYTTATDALGFKYIFDYAQRVGKPCVISFSEGSLQDLAGDNQLYYEFLEKLTGPGRILVASAGNDGMEKAYFHKELGEESKGTFVRWTENYTYLLMRSSDDFTLRTVVYTEDPDTVEYHFEAAMTDTLEISDTLALRDGPYVFSVAGYPSCYDSSERAYEFLVEAPHVFGKDVPVSMEVVGHEADVEVFRQVGRFYESDINPALQAGEEGVFTIHSPGSAPCVICVGATSHRNGFVNAEGKWMQKQFGNDGSRASYSSKGPTIDGRIKPDVLAPGSCVVSAVSSYYLEEKPGESEVNNILSYQCHNGRTYAWNASSGTSMSTPVVAGAIALWLQACPTLSPSQVLDIIDASSTRLQPDDVYPNNSDGYGEIDVYKGLLEVLNREGAGLRNVLSDYQPQHVRFSLSGRSLFIDLATQVMLSNSSPLTVSIYNLSGRLLVRKVFTGADGDLRVDLSTCPDGIVAVQLSSPHRRLEGSTLIRLSPE